MGLETILGGKLKVFSTLIANIDAEAMERQRLSRSVRPRDPEETEGLPRAE